MIKLCHKELTPALTKIINNSMSQCVFPSDLKKAEVIPLYKKKDHLLKENYRPVSILPTLSKIFEHQLSIQLQNHFNKIFDPNVSAYRKKYGCQIVLLNFIDQWRTSLDKGEFVGTFLWIYLNVLIVCLMPYLSVNYTRMGCL